MEDDDEGDDHQMSVAQKTTLHVMMPSGRGRSFISPSNRTNATQSKAKMFFDELINIPGRSEPPEQSVERKPRIIYVRDYPTLAPSSSTWYPHLLSAVRQRRAGPMSRPTSPISNPMTIIFGITPTITPPTSSSSPGPHGQGLISLLMSRSASPSVAASGSRTSKPDWGEDEVADKEREKRLRDRLRKWEKGDTALHDELPTLSTATEAHENSGSPKSGVVVIGGSSGMSGLPPFLESALAGRSVEDRDGSTDSTRFFRTTILVPHTRSVTQERECRMARRREINGLTMRMGVGAVGGILERGIEAGKGSKPTHPQDEGSRGDGDITQQTSDEANMWDDWGRRVEVWTTVRQIGDRAVGSMVAKTNQMKAEKSTLEPTAIPWSAVYKAWGAQRLSGDVRKAWMKESSGKVIREQDEDDRDDKDTEEVDETDEVLERIKQDPELEQHEQKLLPCIVDAGELRSPKIPDWFC